jgi:hypothetical protein
VKFEENENLEKLDRKIERAIIEREPRSVLDFIRRPIHPHTLEEGKDFFDRPGAKPDERKIAKGCGVKALIAGLLISMTGMLLGGYGIILAVLGACFSFFSAMAIYESSSQKETGCEKAPSGDELNNPGSIPSLIDLEQQYHGVLLAEMTVHHLEQMPLDILIKSEIGTATLLPPEIGREEVEVWVDEIKALATSTFFWRQDCGEAFRIITNLAKKYFERQMVMRNDEDLFNMFQIFMMNYAVSCYQFTNNLEPLFAALKWNEKKSLKIRKEIGKSRILAYKNINILVLEAKRKLVAENIKKHTSKSDIGTFNEKLIQGFKNPFTILETNDKNTEILSKIASLEKNHCEKSGDFMEAARSILTLYETVSSNVIVDPISENFDTLGKTIVKLLESKNISTENVERVLLKKSRVTLGPVTYVLKALHMGLKKQNPAMEEFFKTHWSNWFSRIVMRKNLSGYFHKITYLRNKLSHNLVPLSEKEYSELLRESCGHERVSSWLAKKYDLRKLPTEKNSGYLESLILVGTLRI